MCSLHSTNKTMMLKQNNKPKRSWSRFSSLSVVSASRLPHRLYSTLSLFRSMSPLFLYFLLISTYLHWLPKKDRLGYKISCHYYIVKENAFSFQQQKLSINMIQSKILLFHWAKTITTEDKSSHFIELDKFMFKKLQLITRSGFLSSKVEMFTTKSLDKIPWQKWNEAMYTQLSKYFEAFQTIIESLLWLD